MLNRIRFEEEIRESSALKLPPVAKTKTKTKEMEMASKLIDQLTEAFDISAYKDTYTVKLLKIIKDKSRGKKTAAPKLKVVHKQSDNLMEMLKASLSEKKRKTG